MGNVVEDMKQYQRKRWNTWNVYLLNVYHGKYIFIHQLGDAT
jgi:hypothetical protein